MKPKGIYSAQYAELGEGEKNQHLKKEGEKISEGNDAKKGIQRKRGRRGKQCEKEGFKMDFSDILQFNDFSRQKCPSLKVNL